MYNPRTWTAWLAAARDAGVRVRVYMHSSDALNDVTQAWCAQHDVTRVSRVATSWGDPSVSVATRNLFAAALGGRGAPPTPAAAASTWACLLTQQCVPMVSPEDLLRVLTVSLTPAGSALDTLDARKAATCLRARYPSWVAAAAANPVLSAVAWAAIGGALWDAHFAEFAAAQPRDACLRGTQTGLGLDEVFIPSLLTLAGCKIVSRRVTYSHWDASAFRALECDATWCGQRLPGVLDAAAGGPLRRVAGWLFARKFSEGREDGAPAVLLAALRARGVLGSCF